MDSQQFIQGIFNWIVYFWTLPIYFSLGVYFCGYNIVNNIIHQIWLFLETGSPNPVVIVSYENPASLSGPPLPTGLSPGLKRVAQFSK